LTSEYSLMFVTTKDCETINKKILLNFLNNYYGKEYTSVYNDEGPQYNSDTEYRVIIVDYQVEVDNIVAKYASCGRKIIALIPFAEEGLADKIKKEHGRKCVILNEVINLTSWLKWAEENGIDPIVTDFIKNVGAGAIGMDGISSLSWYWISRELDKKDILRGSLGQPYHNKQLVNQFVNYLKGKGIL